MNNDLLAGNLNRNILDIVKAKTATKDSANEDIFRPQEVN